MDFNNDQDRLEYDIHLINQALDHIAENLKRMETMGDELLQLQRRLTSLVNEKDAA